MNTKLVISALVAALALSACAKKEEAPPAPVAEAPAAPVAEAPAAPAAGGAPLKERDQTGRKEARKYPFGEDALGDGENRRRSNKTTTKHPISHAYKKNSPLSFEGLNNHLKKDKKTILNENSDTSKKSYLDESILFLLKKLSIVIVLAWNLSV